MTLKAVIFDLDDTLLWDKKSVDVALEKTSQYIANKAGLDAVKLQRDVCSEAPKLFRSYETYRFAKKIGIGVFEAMWADFNDPGEEFAKLRQVASEYRVKVWQKALAAQDCKQEEVAMEAAAVFKQMRKKYPFLFVDTLGVLDSLKDHFQLLLLTNGSPDLQYTKLELSPELKRYFDHVIISGDFGIGKPDVSIFKHALHQLGVSNKEALMVGDNLNTDILGANRAKIKSVLVKRHENQIMSTQPTYEIAELEDLLPLVRSLT